MCATAITNYRMNLVNDYRSDRPQKLAAGLGSKEQVKGLGGSDQNVRRPAGHCLSFCGRRVAGAYRGPDIDINTFAGAQRGPNPCQRFLQVFMDVIAERLERRNVNYLRFIIELSRKALPKEGFQGSEECGQRFSRPGWGRDQCVCARLNCRPPALLRFGRRTKALLEPTAYDRMETE